MEKENKNDSKIGKLFIAVFIIIAFIINCMIRESDTPSETKKTYARPAKYKTEYSVTYTPYGEVYTVTYKEK